MAEHTAITTNGNRFSDDDHRLLAMLIFRRFGENLNIAASAWRRLLQNNCSDSDFQRLLGDIKLS